MVGRRGMVVLLVVGLATAAGCTTGDRPDPVSTAGMSVSGSAAGGPGSFGSTVGSAVKTQQPQVLSATDRAVALAAAHQDADQIAVGRDSTYVSGWPGGISAVIAAVGPGTVADSNTGHTCDSGEIIYVRLVGAFDTLVLPSATGPGTSGSDNTVRETDLSVDPASGLTCLISVRTQPVPHGPGDTILYRR